MSTEFLGKESFRADAAWMGGDVSESVAPIERNDDDLELELEEDTQDDVILEPEPELELDPDLDPEITDTDDGSIV